MSAVSSLAIDPFLVQVMTLTNFQYGGLYLKVLRKKMELSQNQASDVMGMATGYLEKFESGDRKPGDDSLKKLSQTYRVTVEDIESKYRCDPRLRIDLEKDYRAELIAKCAHVVDGYGRSRFDRHGELSQENFHPETIKIGDVLRSLDPESVDSPTDHESDGDQPKSTLAICVNADFSKLINKCAAERDMTVAAFCDGYLSSVLDQIHRDYLRDELSRMEATISTLELKNSAEEDHTNSDMGLGSEVQKNSPPRKVRHRKIPAYSLHKPSGQAVVRLEGKDRYLGKHGTPKSYQKYEATIAEWIASEGSDCMGRPGLFIDCGNVKEIRTHFFDLGFKLTPEMVMAWTRQGIDGSDPLDSYVIRGVTYTTKNALSRFFERICEVRDEIRRNQMIALSYAAERTGSEPNRSPVR